MELLTILSVQLSQFAAPANCTKNFLGLETWFAYFPNSWFGGVGYGTCDLNGTFSNQLLPSSGESALLLIGLAIVDDLLRIASLIAVGYVIYGGFNYMTSNGSADGTKRAQQTIINALVGLALAITAASIVAFIGNKLSSG